MKSSITPLAIGPPTKAPMSGFFRTQPRRGAIGGGGWAARHAALHVAKNCLEESIDGRVPLILGIWGGKGCGKSMNLELCCKRLGVSPIIVSAGELEDQWAGEPGKRLRERYRRAAQVMQTEGRPACLIINDLDAGAGRVKNTTGYTVNTQMVSATLMNLADHPTDVQVGEYWVASHLPRVPIVITANDLSTLYAPLVRDGRMHKFCWHPTRADLAHMVGTLFADDGVTATEVEALLDAFPQQPLDFFGALRNRLYDSAVRQWIGSVGGHRRMGESLRDCMRGAAIAPVVHAPAHTVSLDTLLAAGASLAYEQQQVMDGNLSRDYLHWQTQVWRLCVHIPVARSSLASLMHSSLVPI